MRNKKITHIMAGVIMLLFMTAFTVIAGRYLYIGATGEIAGVDLKAWAKEKRTANYQIPAERGKILDSQGMTLAYDRPVFKVYAIVDPEYSKNLTQQKHVDNVKDTAKLLAKHLEMNEKDIQNKLEQGIKENKFQVEFGTQGRNISQQLKEKIAKENIPGIYFAEEADRYYPNGTFASHILGFAQKKADDGALTGITGIEKEMNEVLSGENGRVSFERDKHGIKLLDPNEVIKQQKDGQNIHLTLDQKIQTLLEDALTQVEDQYEPKKVTALVMNPKTGEILAMSSRPSYNPNNPSNIENWYNDAISTPFEPGSTVKMFTWAAAIEEGVYEGNKKFKSGRYKPNEKIEVISDHNNGKGWGSITYDEGFARSSNVAASKLVWDEIGPDVFENYLKDFHLNEKTGIDLPGETSGHILYNWPSEKLRTAFGQGSTVTPIQQMTAATAIANKGHMMKPYVIDKVSDSTSGKIKKQKEPEVIGQPISETTANQVKNLLDDVVNSKNGTGKSFSLKDYTVIGKTGTAQIPNSEGKGYMTGRSNYVFSFLGMAPKEDPELLMYVAVQQPELADDEQGSDPVSFIFTNVMGNGLHYLSVDPDKENEETIEQVELPNLKNDSTAQLQKQLEEKQLEVVVVGDGKKVDQINISQDDILLENSKVLLITDQPKMPDVTGWSMREIHELSSMLDLQLETIGNGFVIQQSIEKGKKIKKGDYLGIELEQPGKQKKKPKKESDQSKKEKVD